MSIAHEICNSVCRFCPVPRSDSGCRVRPAAALFLSPRGQKLAIEPSPVDQSHPTGGSERRHLMICRLHCASASGRLTAHQGARRPGILVADDEACVREWLRAALQRHGFRVWLAADGEQAIDLYRRRRSEIVLVLLDVRMPVLNGPQTLARLRQMNPTVLCCFMSGNGAE